MSLKIVPEGRLPEVIRCPQNQAQPSADGKDYWTWCTGTTCMMASEKDESDPLHMRIEDFKSLLFCLGSRYGWDQLHQEADVRTIQGNTENTEIRTPETISKSRLSQSLSKSFCSSSSRSVVVKSSSRSRTARRILSDSGSEQDCMPMAMTAEATTHVSPKPSSLLGVEGEVVMTSKRSARARIILSDDSDSEVVRSLPSEMARPTDRVTMQVRAMVVESSDSSIGEEAGLSDSGGSVEGSALGSEDSAEASEGDEYQYDDWLVEDGDDARSYNCSDVGGDGGSDSDRGRGGAEDKENSFPAGSTNREVPVPAKLRPLTATAPVTPKVGRKQANFQRVLALSTGKKRTKSYHHSLAQDLFRIYNEVIFDGQLPQDLPVTWNKRLLTTAGFCKCWKKPCGEALEVQRCAAIELSTKVVDSEERMRETLVHEMCHAATFLIDGVDHAHHGPLFKRWGRRATRRFPDIGVVNTCHSYEIHAAHKFQCVKGSCGVTYSRHTKKGLNVDRQRCGVCCSRLEYVGMTKKDGTAVKPRQATGFSAFVREHFARVKAAMADCGEAQSTKDVMRELAARYKEQKGRPAAAAAARAEEQDEFDEPLYAGGATTGDGECEVVDLTS